MSSFTWPPSGGGSVTGTVTVSGGTIRVTPNTAGSFVDNPSLSTVTSLSPPANSVGFILEASSSNTANIRWCIGAVATTSSGMRMEPGRDTGFVPCAAIVSVCAESGTQEIMIQWILSS